jgi:TonB family protein
MKPHRIALVVLLLAAVPVVAAAQRCPGSDPRTPRGRVEVERVAEGLARRAVADSLRPALVSASGAAGVAAPVGLVLIERSRRRTTVRVVGGNVPGTALEPVVALHAELLELAPARDPVVFVRLEGVPAAEGAAECPPHPRDLGLVTRAFTAAVNEHHDFRGGPPPSLTLSLLVSRDGEVVHAAVTRRSGNDRFDEAIRAAMTRMRFTPATLGGTPVDVLLELPISVSGGR